MRNLCAITLSIVFLASCSSPSKIEKSTCGDGRTILDGVCVKNEIADYVSCVRAQGMQLVSNESQTLSADAGYFGINASAANEVSERLERKYTASDSAMKNIIDQCNKLSGIHSENHQEVKSVPSKISVNTIEGDYRYLNKGRLKLTQEGEKITMFLTWPPAGKGPHYEIQGVLKDNVIEGEWYSHQRNQGWYYFYAEVSASGRNIDFTGSEDPIGSGMGRLKVSKH